MTDPAPSSPRGLWQDTLGSTPPVRPPLPGDRDADVAIVGAGFTGLWTAYYLLTHDPSLRVAILDAETTGFGASGRNGGWCVGELAAGPERIAAAFGPERALAQARAVFGAVDEIGRVVAAEGIACEFHKGGTVRLARNPAQAERLRDEIDGLRRLGFHEDDWRLLNATEATERVRATKVVAGTYFAHTAVVHPARLVHGLAAAVEAKGGLIYEQTRALTATLPLVRTERGALRAPIVVRATEGYTAALPGLKRRLAPLYSLMVATEPLADAIWAEIGLADRETFADDRHLVIYGQRTADGRIAFGGRGAPYGYGSRIDPAIESGSGTHELIIATLRELFPVLADTSFTHRWGGVLGVPRDWFPTVAFDRASGVGWAGGYVGDGVVAANLAGQTLADLIVGADTDRVHLPWVGHRSRRWEPEPLRWLGINGALRVMGSADRAEERTGRPARRAGWLWRLIERG